MNSPPCWRSVAEVPDARHASKAGLANSAAGALLLTSASRHAVGRDVVVTPGPNALLLFGRGHGTWRRRPVRGPAFISPEVSRPNPAGPWFSPRAGKQTRSPRGCSSQSCIARRTRLLPPPGGQSHCPLCGNERRVGQERHSRFTNDQSRRAPWYRPIRASASARRIARAAVTRAEPRRRQGRTLVGTWETARVR